MASRSLAIIAKDVAALLGETLALECAPEESPFPDLKDRVRLLVPEILGELIKESPELCCEMARSYKPTVTINTDGEVSMPLPADFMRLTEIKMSDWSRPVTEITLPGSESYCQNESNWTGIRGNPDRPVAIIEGAGTERVLRLYTSSQGAKLDRAYYLPRPEFDDSGTIEIGAGVYHTMLRKVAEALKEL